MPAYVAPPKKAKVKTSSEADSARMLSDDDLLYIREQMEELDFVKKELALMKQKEADRVAAEMNRGIDHNLHTSDEQYRTPHRNVRIAMERGSPVTTSVFKQDPEYYQRTGLYNQFGNPIWGVPKNKDMKLALAKFSAKETYKGLGTGINEWTSRFLRQLERAQLASGVCWSEDVKMDVLEDHLEGKA